MDQGTFAERSLPLRLLVKEPLGYSGVCVKREVRLQHGRELACGMHPKWREPPANVQQGPEQRAWWDVYCDRVERCML